VYIVAGIFMSPYMIGIIDKEFLDKSNIITHASLSLGEAEIAFLFVVITMAVYLFLFQDIDIKMLIALAFVFGALASPTDPTATLAVIHEFRAKGVLTTTVLGVAALDDATGIINFVIGYSVATSLVGGNELSLFGIGKDLILQIGGAILLGLIMGYIMHFLGSFAEERKEVVTVTVGILFLTFSLAHTLGVDELLSTMTTGITLVNIDKDNEKFKDPLENYIEDVIFTAFFVVGSAFLNLKILAQYFPMVFVYVISRFAH